MLPRNWSRVRNLFFSLLLISSAAHAAAAAPANIILVTLESTRADRMGFLGSRSGLTPHLDALARQSIVFERAYAQAPLTVVSHATILSGSYPQTNQASDLGNPISNDTPWLPRLLHAKGYRTAAFVGTVALDPENGLAPGFERGFDVYDADFHPDQPLGGRERASQRTADEVVVRATKWLNANSMHPFFLWVQLNDADAPETSYNRAVARVNAAAGKLVATLEALGLYDDAIVVVASDHGEALGSHAEGTHGTLLYDETIRVPLLLKLPQNQLAGKRVRGRVRLLDIAPSALEAARIPVPSQMQGQSLLRIARTNPDVDQPAYARTDFPQQAFGWSPLESWRVGKYLYIRAPKPELYDLTRDPATAHNLAQTSKAILDTMASQLESFRSHFGNQSGRPASELTSTEIQKLASLGYVGLQKSSSDPGSAPTGTDPKDAIATANQVLKVLGRLSSSKSEVDAQALQQAVSQQPHAFLAQYSLGLVLARQQHYPQAIEHLHKAIELQPASVWAHYAMGRNLINTGDFKTAAVHLELVRDRMPKFREARLRLAQSYEHLGQSKQAEAERDKAGH